jgi:hypothetical protein
MRKMAVTRVQEREVRGGVDEEGPSTESESLKDIVGLVRHLDSLAIVCSLWRHNIALILSL